MEMDMNEQKITVKQEKYEGFPEIDSITNQVSKQPIRNARRAASERAKNKIKIEVFSDDDEYESNPQVSSDDADYNSEQHSSNTIPRTRKRKLKIEEFSDDECVAKSVVKPKKQKGAVKAKQGKKNKNEVVDAKGLDIKNTKIKTENVEKQLWSDYKLLSELHNINENISLNLIKLFEEGNTIPFIARYRKDVTDNMSPEELRDVKDLYDKILALKARAQTVLRCVEKSGNLNPELKRCILSARSIEEVEHIYAPYKPGGKRTLAERAKALGLEEPALVMLHNTGLVDLYRYLDQQNGELDNFDKIEKGIMHIIAHVIATDIEVLSFLRKLRAEVNFAVEVKKCVKKSCVESKAKPPTGKPVDESKFENYFDFKIPVKYIKPHQVLAINRGESQKVLSVKIDIPDFVFNKFCYFCTGKWTNRGRFDKYRKKVLDESIKDSYARLIQPLITREIRSDLKTKAVKASYEVFSNNLKQLLLASPIKGRPILGIDPGFTNGCKIALVSSAGVLLQSNILYPLRNNSHNDKIVLKDMLKKYNCNLIALGNGTACRETEAWISDLIKMGTFAPLNVTYTIVSENGASIYSCSKEARKEFATLDPNLISAVSLARRVQDPLAELVKVEPKHLGVGMYQHDLPKKQLEEALDEVVSECVSFVGVDLNTTSQCLLRRIAGLSDKRATQIIEYREENGPFRARKDLLSVKGIGRKIFQQCAGFLRVGPLNAEDAVDFYKNPTANKLDFTIIHPESYEIAVTLMKRFNLDENQIGEDSFINSIKTRITRTADYKSLSDSLNTTEQTFKLIVEALSKRLDYDFRVESLQVPLFRKSLTSMEDLKTGVVLTGCVTNVTHFGCFVDIGVGCNGLIHVSKMKGQNLQIGNRVEVTIVNLEVNRKRIGLELNKLM